MKLYVKRVFITDEAELLPRYLRFVRGLIDTADLPLNVSREMIQESPLLASIRKGLTNRILTSIEKLAENEPDTFAKLWDNFGSVIKEGIYEDFERRSQLLALSRFRTTASDEKPRALSDYVRDMKEGQSAIYYLTGDNLAQLKASPQLEGFRARGIEVLLLTDPVDSFWVTTAPDFEGKPLKSITQGAADLADVAKRKMGPPSPEASASVTEFVNFTKATLGEAVSDVRTSDRLTESAVCLVAAEHGPDRQLQRCSRAPGATKARQNRSSRSTPAMRSSQPLPPIPRRTGSFARMRQNCCSTRPVFSTATSQKTRVPSRSVCRACSIAH